VRVGRWGEVENTGLILILSTNKVKIPITGYFVQEIFIN
jgi:hypothetical protein